jgi:recombination protein RecT
MASGPTTDRTGQIVKPPSSNGEGSLAGFLQKLGPEIKRALPKHITGDRMSRIVLTALRTTRDLALCTPESFAGCVMQLSQLGLEPNTMLGHAYLIPRRNKRLPPDKRECTAIVGYQGYIELARRSGMVASIYAYAAREGDDFWFRLGLNPDVHHEPSGDADRETKPITHVYAVAAMRDSTERVFVVLTRAQVEARRKRSNASGDGPWVTDYEAMCLKTAVRALWKWLPKSTEMARAEALETAVDAGVSQVTALDPMVSDALANHGLLAEDAEIIDTAQPVGTEPNVDRSEAEPAPAAEPSIDQQLQAVVADGGAKRGR